MFPVLRCATVIALIVQLGCSANPTTAPLRYPAARTVDVVDDYHGSKVPDPYRWLEEPDSQEVVGWAAAQTEVAKSLLRQNDIRPWLLTRVAELVRLQGVGVPVASALLHFTDPEKFPILDFRALASLGDLRRRTTYTNEFWVSYLQRCQALADDIGVSVRDLDKALWQASKTGEGSR